MTDLLTASGQSIVTASEQLAALKIVHELVIPETTALGTELSAAYAQLCRNLKERAADDTVIGTWAVDFGLAGRHSSERTGAVIRAAIACAGLTIGDPVRDAEIVESTDDGG